MLLGLVVHGTPDCSTDLFLVCLLDRSLAAASLAYNALFLM